ncbi:MAG TPA: R2-like ligand-binding oxidase [Chloroflexus aurantiacus]|jgi:ribonucleoside-diphosphate reductase beta chain|uniref:R2-like ligand binding oxidase n=1 Tax=Chloroflexus aurantiacus (strain ATCC 29366 / DSM 635 / J-10-fl) TaxID=324602 RepID=A9WJQ1_CHLAA|nr:MULTISPECIES: R2-like ligand-binding oxidase [Chloroflexus]ABY36517.1 ribonucleotide reductase [Chloroflexus aurantiacus J-10-fl]HBW68958.1 R2-like ligand-binding oxidase [Chloroflexus aurantiacus]
MSHTDFVTTSRGLNRNSPPMRLFEKAKRFGIWNPSLIDLSRDIRDWEQLRDEERDLLLRLTALFQAGEEAVTLDLLPLIRTIAREGRLEEELYLTTFLFEEAKHTDFFARFISEVARVDPDLSRYHTASYRALIYEALPAALHRLDHDPSPLNLAEASLTYNMIVEGVLAETGYHAYFTILDSQDIMPGTREGIRLLKQDESRHIAYGVYLLSRLIATDPQVWDHIVERMNELVLYAMGVIDEIFACYDPMPFNLQIETFSTFALNQFQRRLNRLELASRQSMNEIDNLATDDEESV